MRAERVASLITHRSTREREEAYGDALDRQARTTHATRTTLELGDSDRPAPVPLPRGTPQVSIVETLHLLKRAFAALRGGERMLAARWLELTALETAAHALPVWELSPTQEADAVAFVASLDAELAAVREELPVAERTTLAEWIDLRCQRADLVDEVRRMSRAAALGDGEPPKTTEEALLHHQASVELRERLRGDELPPFSSRWRAHALMPAGQPTKEAALQALHDLSSRSPPVRPVFPRGPSVNTNLVVRVGAVITAALAYFPFKLGLIGLPVVAAMVVLLAVAVTIVGILAGRARRLEWDEHVDFEDALTDYTMSIQRVAAWDALLRKRVHAEEERQEALLLLASRLRAVEEFDAHPARGGRLADAERAYPDLVAPVTSLLSTIRRAHTDA